jgi:hypothetical protein
VTILADSQACKRVSALRCDKTATHQIFIHRDSLIRCDHHFKLVSEWMKLIQFQFTRSARSLRILQRSKQPRISPPAPAGPWITRSRNFSASFKSRTEDADMAPKGQKFDLKVPKGTKDCTFLKEGNCSHAIVLGMLEPQLCGVLTGGYL